MPAGRLPMRAWPFWLLLLATAQAQYSRNFFDNDVVGDPQILCEPDQITVAVQTRNVFIGNLYVRGHFNDRNCIATFQENKNREARISIKINDCGMIKSAQSEPHGFNYSTHVVVSFHPLFETRQDEAYSVNCFYNTEPVNVLSDMSIREHMAQPPEPFVGVVENKCQYSIRVDSVEGPLARMTEIGQPVVHRWDCEDRSMGILVRDCYALSEPGFNIEVIDERGCPTSAFFEELTYNNDQTMAFVRVETFKFPDVDTIRFACNISFCNKNQNNCLGVTPPNCPRVRRADYRPDSYTDERAHPTHVVSFIQDPTQRQYPTAQPVHHTTSGFMGGIFRQITTSTMRPFWSNRQPVQKDYVKDEGPEFEEVLTAKQLPVIAPISSQTPQQANPPNSSTTSPVLLLKGKRDSLKPPVYPMGNERNFRARRDDQTLKVRAERMFVADSLDAAGPRKRSIIIPPPTAEHAEKESFCLNRTTSTVLIVLLSVLSAFSLATSAYILYDLCSTRHHRLKAQITARRDAISTSAMGNSCSIKAFHSLSNK